jgi:predicted DNA-binding antitoxin AbrB/MazE fold protein
MSQAIDAIFENGGFRLLETPDPPLSEGQQVRLLIETPSKNRNDDLLELAAEVYDGLSGEQIDEIEQMALNRRVFFGDRNSP